MWSYQTSLTGLKCHSPPSLPPWGAWPPVGGSGVKRWMTFQTKSFMHQLQSTHSVNKMYYLDNDHKSKHYGEGPIL